MANRSDNPLSRAFWLGSVDPRPLALFRIGLGATILQDLVHLTRDFRAFLTDDGMLPRGTVHDPLAWGLLDLVGTPVAVGVVYALGCLAVLAFTVGWKTRAATFASWLFLLSLHHRNDFMTDGGDAVVRILLFFSLFGDLGAAYGIDARRRATRVVDVPAMGLRLLQIEVAVLYFCAGRLKARVGWLHGDPIFYALQLDGFLRPPGVWLERFPTVCRWAAKGVVAMECAFPLVAFAPFAIPWTRGLAVALGVGLQLGIFVTMRVGIFTQAMLVVMALLFVPAWIDRAEAWLRARGWVALDARPTSEIAPTTWSRAFGALGVAQLVLAVWGAFVGGRLPLPRALASEVRFVDLEAKYSLFDKNYDAPHWEAKGTLADGTAVDVLSVVAPGAAPRGPAWSFSRWGKINFKEADLLYPELLGYFCRAYEEQRPGSHLASVVLIDHAEPPRPPGAPPPEPQNNLLAGRICS